MLFLITITAVLAVLFLNAFVVIPPYHFGVWSLLGSRVRGEMGILSEGLHFVWPFVSSVELVSKELVPKDVKFSLTTKDRLHLTIEGVFQYRPDPRVLYREPNPDYGRNVFVTVSEESILKGVIETLEAKIGGLGGKYNHDAFIESRQAISDLINAVLRMERAPHLRHRPGAGNPDPERSEEWDDPDWRFCGVDGCAFPEEEVDAKSLVEFYNTHWRQIKIIMANEKNRPADRSEIERRYGIDVESFDLGTVGFTAETEAALEEEKQAERRALAGKERIETAKKFRDELGVSPQTAADESDLLLDPAVKKNVISVQGEAGILGGLLGRLAKKGD